MELQLSFKPLALLANRMKAEFDQFAKNYTREVETALPFFAREHEVFVRIKAALIERLVSTLPTNSRPIRALDVGCGTGTLERFLHPETVQVQGIDVSPDELQIAQKDNPTTPFALFDGRTIPFKDHSFDLVFAICVFHHVPPPHQLALMAEMERVTKPGGAVMLIEHNPLNPMTRRVVARCVFDRDAILLTARETEDLMGRAGLPKSVTRYFMFLPFDGKLARLTSQLLQRCPLGAQYCTMGYKANAA